MCDDLKLEYKGYTGSFELEDGILWHGKILNIDDLITYESYNHWGLVVAFETAVDDYLEFCKENNK